MEKQNLDFLYYSKKSTYGILSLGVNRQVSKLKEGVGIPAAPPPRREGVANLENKPGQNPPRALWCSVVWAGAVVRRWGVMDFFGRGPQPEANLTPLSFVWFFKASFTFFCNDGHLGLKSSE